MNKVNNFLEQRVSQKLLGYFGSRRSTLLVREYVSKKPNESNLKNTEMLNGIFKNGIDEVKAKWL